MELTLNTPAILFPAISLLMLAYTNRFLALAGLIRNLHTKFLVSRENEKIVLAQLKNLRLRIKLIKYMQGLGVLSIFLCVLCMALLYVNYSIVAQIIFGVSLLIFLASLTLSLIEINISTNALELELSDMEEQ
ncbi:MAG: DUF2721 domain-containing protein [Bacteroidota bacterium]|jgi:hypothetical protein